MFLEMKVTEVKILILFLSKYLKCTI
jgi:hypothetical protein